MLDHRKETVGEEDVMDKTPRWSSSIASGDGSALGKLTSGSLGVSLWVDDGDSRGKEVLGDGVTLLPGSISR